MSGTIGSYLIATKAISQLTTLEFPEQFCAHFPAGHRAKKTRDEAQQKSRGCLAPLVVISLPPKQFRNSPHSSFQNNFAPIFPQATERKKTRDEAQQKSRGCLAPLGVISLPPKQFRNSPHSSFQNNFAPIFPQATEKKNERRGAAEVQGMSGTIGSYLIATKSIPQLTTLEFPEQFYAHFPAGHRAKKKARRGAAEVQGMSGTIGSYLIATKAIP